MVRVPKAMSERMPSLKRSQIDPFIKNCRKKVEISFSGVDSSSKKKKKARQNDGASLNPIISYVNLSKNWNMDIPVDEEFEH